MVFFDSCATLFDILKQYAGDFIYNWFYFFNLHDPTHDYISNTTNKTDDDELREGTQERIIRGAKWQQLGSNIRNCARNQGSD